MSEEADPMDEEAGPAGEPTPGAPAEPAGARARGGAGRRQLALAVLGCVAGAGLVLFAASRTWRVDEGYRPVPLPPLGIPHSGGDLVPAIPALGVVALAGAGALLATRGLGRLLVGALLSFLGLATIVLLQGVLGPSSDVDMTWVGVVAAGGLMITAAGVLTLRSGRSWPGLGARYERAGAGVVGTPRGHPARAPDGEGAVLDRPAVSDRPGEPAADSGTKQHTAWWDAIDRGEDPTKP